MDSSSQNKAGNLASEVQTLSYLTFTLGAEEYGIDLLKIQEIKGYSTVTPIPNTPKYVKGVMNLRGTVVPVVDLRAKFGLNEVEYNKFTVIIVVMLGKKVTGLVVDAVSDVLNVAKTNIQAAPAFGASIDTSFLTGMARTGEKLVLLLDMDKLLGNDAKELATLGVTE